MTIVSLGVNRVSVPMQVNRSYNSLMGAQSLVNKYNYQLMTERQYQYGSESPYNASRTLAVQSEMERKAQMATNLGMTLSYLSATDTTLAQYNSLTDEVRGMAITAINTTTSDAERSSLASSTKTILQQMFEFGNYSYQGRNMFSGSTTSTNAFEWGKDSYSVVYRGSASNVYSWSDIDILSQSNVTGAEAFGALSDPVGGSDLNPSLTESTRLSDLNGGNGVEKGSIRFTYQYNGKTITQDVDLSKCSTVGDVIKTIEGMSNSNFSVQVDLTENGLVFSLASGTPGIMTISEVGKGTTARELGIPINQSFSSEKSLVGRDVDPALTSTTLLSDLLGSRATLNLTFAGANNDIVLTAKYNGETYTDDNGKTWSLNGVGVAIQSDSNTTPGNETATYDPETNQIIVRIHPDNSSANDIIAAINKASEAGEIPPFEANLSHSDETRSDLAGTGLIPFLPGTHSLEGQTRDGSGENLDKAGIQIVNGNETYDISFENFNTVGELLAELNDPKYGLLATINDTKTGINIQTRVSGTDFCIGELGGTTASQLGIRTSDLDTQLSQLDYGRGVNDYDGPGTQAKASYSSVTPNSDLLLTAKNAGKEWNDYTIRFVPTDDPNGEVIVSMNEEDKTITVGINPGVTTACEIVDAFNSQPGAKEFFDLTLDNSSGVNTGEGVVYDGSTKTSGGSDGGIDFTITRNDGTVLEIDIKGAKTLGDVLDIINNHPDNDGLLVATLAASGNGIELTDKSFGNSVTRVDRTLLSTAAIELGLIPQGEEYRSVNTAVDAGDVDTGKVRPGETASTTIAFDSPNSSLLVKANHTGTYANDYTVEFVEADENNPVGFSYDPTGNRLVFTIESGVTTANDIVEIFHSQASPQVLAMFDVQNGTRPDGQPSDGSGTVGLVETVLSGGTDNVLTGTDPNPQEADSLFTALIRLHTAMVNNDEREIERATQMLDTAAERITAVRGSIGTMQQSLDNIQYRLEDENIQHEEVLNSTLRVDFADASLNYVTQMYAYQAIMQLTSSMFQMSLLNYL